MKNTDRIYIKTWLDFKPYDKQVTTDTYYLNLSNDIKQAITKSKQYFVLKTFIDETEINFLACFLASYLEDLVSGSNLWNTFVKQHSELYNKPIPFYDTLEYFEEEINIQDVCFLIWYYLHTIQDEKALAPTHPVIVEIAEKVFNIFEEAWEFAPENEHLTAYYSLNENEKDFYIVRNFVDNILFKSYLFYPDALLDLRDIEMDIIEEFQHREHLIDMLNDNRDRIIHKIHTRLLSMNGKEWGAKLLGKNHPLYYELPNMSRKIQGYFFYKGQDKDNVFIEHIASGKKFNLTKKSFDHYESLTVVDEILHMGIVQWFSEWWFSGVYFKTDFNADLVLDEKNSIESRKVVNFLDHKDQDMDELFNSQLKAFKKFTNGSQIVFLKSNEFDTFFKEYIESYNSSLNLSEAEMEESKQRQKAEGYFGEEDKKHDFSDISESGLVFFNPKSGVELALAVNSAFPLPNNPFFNESESKDHILRLFINEELSKELAMFCIEHCKSKLPFFEEPEGAFYLKNFDFLMRFWKKQNYHTKPELTFTGTN